MELASSPESGLAGIVIANANQYFESEDFEEPFWKDISSSYHKLLPSDLEKLGVLSMYKSGYTFNTIIADQKYYLPWIMAKLKKMGVSFIKQSLSSLEDVQQGDRNFHAIVNCAGLGAGKLMNDCNVYPIRGQVEIICYFDISCCLKVNIRYCV